MIVLLPILFLLLSFPAAATGRIVTLAPVLSEWTAEILGPAEASRRIVGVSEFSLYPSGLRTKPTVGPYPNPRLEAILALRPDLVIASEEYNPPEQLRRMKELGLPVRVLPRERFSEMEAWIQKLGGILGEDSRARRVAGAWRRLRHGMGKARAPFRRAFVEVQRDPMITIGAGSFLSEALREAGFETIFSDAGEGYPKVSLEAVLQRNPDWIFILDHGAGDASAEKRAREAWSRFPGLSAVKNGRIRLLSGDDFARCSLRLLNALKKLSSLHAE